MRSVPVLKPSLLCLLCAAAMLPAHLARAADYDPPVVVDQAPEYTPVEVGSSWYLRGDIGAAVNDFEHSDDDGFERNKQPFVGSIAMGYHWTDYLRSEVNLGILPSDKFSNEYRSACAGSETITKTDSLTDAVISIDTGTGTRPCDRRDEGSNRSYSLFANAYVDLGTFAGLTPYLGGGVGAVYTKTRASRGDQDCEDYTSTSASDGETTVKNFTCYDDDFYKGSLDSDGQYNFAYNLGAGLSYRVSTNGSIDLGYEYINVPDAKTVSYENNEFVYDKGIDVHSVKLGFRYDVW